MDSFNPLTPAHYQAIHAGCESCAQVTDYLRKLSGIGHKVDTHMETVRQSDEYLKGVLRAFPQPMQ